MKRLLILLLAASASAPALAQHSGHSAPPPPAEEEPDPHAGHDMPAAPPSQPAPPQTDPHAGHAMPAPAPPAPPQATDPHAGHAMPPQPSGSQPSGPHQGHDMAAPQPATDPHAGHQMEPTQAPAPPVAPPPPEASSGPQHAADLVFGTEQMADVREETRRLHGGMRFYRFTIDQLEVALRDGRDGYAWEDVQFRYGGDIDKLWIKSEGEGTFGEGVESAEVQALWSHAIDPWFDLQAGLRYDFRPDPERAYLVLGVQGLAPYWFEVDAAAFISDKGDISARVEAENDQRITQRLILQPRVELDLALQDVPEIGVGSGLSTAEAGLRLRYEIVPEFAPYVGVQYEHAFGDTRRFRRLASDDVGGWSLVLGVKAWF